MNLPLWRSLLFTAIGAVHAYETIQGRSCLRSMKGMMDSMNDLANQYSDLLTISDIGDSYLKTSGGSGPSAYPVPSGGYDIFALKVTSNDGGRSSDEKGKMLVTSGVHAREWAPPELLGRFIETLVRGYDNDADATWILQHTEIHAILYVNPDGRYIAETYPESLWRKNLNPEGGCSDAEYGVDINRNFDFMWDFGDGASDSPCDSDYHGPSPESEPETRALSDYAKSIFPSGQRKQDPEGQINQPFGEDISGMYVDLHSFGGYVYYPWGHKDAKSPDDEALQALGRKMNSFNHYKLWAGSQPDYLYEASGDTSDYMYAVLGVASMGFEIGNDFHQDCGSFESDVVPINLPALLYAAKLAAKPYKEVKGPDVLDLSATADSNGSVTLSALASDSQMVDAIQNFPDFSTGDQLIQEVKVYVDVHPDDAQSGDTVLSMKPTGRRTETLRKRKPLIDCSLITQKKRCKRAGGGSACSWDRNRRVCEKSTGGSNTSSGSGYNADDTTGFFWSENDGNEPGSGSGNDGDNNSGSGSGNTEDYTDDNTGTDVFGSTSDNSGSGSEINADIVGSGSDYTASAEVTPPPVTGEQQNGGSVAYSSGEEYVELTIENLSPGRHALFVQATDSSGYKGPVTSVFVDVSGRRTRRDASLRGAKAL